MSIEGSLQVSIATVKAFLSRLLVQNSAESSDLQIGMAGDPILGFLDLGLPIHYTTFMTPQ